ANDPRCALRCRRGRLNCFCGGTDYIDHPFRLGEHRHVAAVELIGGCAHALGEEALQVGMHGLVFFADDIPAWLRLPSGSPDFRPEQVGFGDALSRPNELLLLLRKISTELLRALASQPDTTVQIIEVRAYICLRGVRWLSLR